MTKARREKAERQEKERQEKERQTVKAADRSRLIHLCSPACKHSEPPANLKTDSGGKEKRKTDKGEKKATARQWRLDKINALKEKFYAVASKRKWLVLLIGIALLAYFVISSGGLNLGGIFEKIKGIF
tara:strand:- start:68 stop:451 length:384 start_codon:yes stop_codon:yes gene_type:complete